MVQAPEAQLRFRTLTPVLAVYNTIAFGRVYAGIAAVDALRVPGVRTFADFGQTTNGRCAGAGGPDPGF